MPAGFVMKDLIGRVLEAYEQDAPTFPVRKQFHFYSRLFLWSEKRRYSNEIQNLFASWWPGEDKLITQLKRVPTTLTARRRFAGIKEYRQVSAEKHPKVFTYNRIFFKLLFAETVYGLSGATIFKNGIDHRDLELTVTQLISDPESVAKLSTHAVNFLYLVRRFEESFDLFTPALFRNVASMSPNEMTVFDLHARIYLLTHTIIGESGFYERRVLTSVDTLYDTYYLELERIIRTQYARVSLDQKFEFLVCMKLLAKQSALYERILDEALQSFDEQGNYFVNRHNSYYRKHARSTRLSTEHQNVLAIMAFGEELLF
jgi:hypothetical protein